jgi:hypothetical protein
VNKLCLHIVILLLAGFFVGNNIYGQQKIDSLILDRPIYWFPVRAKIGVDTNTQKERFYLSNKRKKIKSGTILDFEKELFRRAIRRKELLIGPFSEKKDAIYAIPLYDLSNFNEKTMELEILSHQGLSENFDYYWFFLDLKPQRSHPPLIRRNPVRLASGNLRDFRIVLWEGVFFKAISNWSFYIRKRCKNIKKAL